MDIPELISHIESSVANAENGISKIIPDVINIIGCTGLKTKHFYNNLLSMSDARYLEIGTWKGTYTCSAMCGNKATITCIDNCSQIGSKNCNFLIDFNKYGGDNTIQFIEQNCYTVDTATLPKFNIYMYNGAHSMDIDYNTLEYYFNCLDDTFIYIIDNWNFTAIKDIVARLVRRFRLTVLYNKEIILADNSHTLAYDTWYNGLYVAILQKHK